MRAMLTRSTTALLSLLPILWCACSDPEPPPPPAGTVALYEAGCETTADCIEGVCIDALGANYCAPECQETACPDDTVGSCVLDADNNSGCRVECTDGACPADLACTELGDKALCVAKDAPNIDICSPGFTRCDGVCLRVTEDPAHCGACGKACAVGAVCVSAQCACPDEKPDDCSGVCVSNNTDLQHCGLCNTPCARDNASAACIAGECTLVACDEGFLSCDDESENGCEIAADAVPTAVIDVIEGNQVDELTELHLSGESSTAPTSAIASYAWSVSVPPGAQGEFLPNSTTATPTFTADVIGTYAFTLEVKDGDGNPNCAPGKRNVLVIPAGLAHIELLWTGGGDLDIHLAHEDAGDDPWFDAVNDCWANNATPEWGEPIELKDNPTLKREDGDSPGLEVLSLPVPQFEKNYRLAIHYKGDGEPADAEIRIHANDKLEYGRTGVNLIPGDLWDVGTLNWEDQNFEPALKEGGEPVIEKNVQVP